MKHSIMLLISLVFTLFCLVGTYAGSDRIKLKEIQVLTLRRGQKTTARRTSPMPQLSCVGGTARCSYIPETVQCYNRGWDGRSVNWECKAEMDKKYAFGILEVSCEGYDHPDDSYVLAGSCGLEYTIDLVDGSSYKPKANFHPPPPHIYKNIDSTSSESSIITIVIFIVLIGLFYCFCTGKMRRESYQSSQIPSAPPPPAGFMPGFQEPPPDYHSATYGSHYGSTSPLTEPNSPGFGTGLLTGGVLGYLFGRNNNADPGSVSYTTTSGEGTSSSFRRDSSPTRRDSSPTRTASGFATTKRR
ncbi:store-operated calcium entry-associated regulatory factor-like [Brevipalpus obovatus]|uniref:store-operated calcium entry-associated regulatory factor-like n=1 Tax=Brevipalpus obovatus TaxID=246614 RepID=UPI003D9E37B8